MVGDGNPPTLAGSQEALDEFRSVALDHVEPRDPTCHECFDRVLKERTIQETGHLER
jgi:hypothetical protein